MKTKLIYSFIIVALLATVFTACKDDFTEEDALNAQQTITFNVVAINVTDQQGVEGAEVTVVLDGAEVTATTNSLGAATFKNVKIGSGFPVTIAKEGFVTINTTMGTNGVDYRQAEVSAVLYMLSSTSTATLSGKVEIETDVTNDTREKVTTGTVKATFEPGYYNGFEIYSNFTVEATIGADGTYTMNLPTFGTGVEYTISVNDLEVDQKMAYNKKPGEQDFPITLPKAENIKTVFSHNSGSVTIPSFVPAVFAVINATPTGASAEVALLDVETNPDGEIFDINIFDSGFGYPASSTTVPVTITSLLGGSGATATASTNASGQITSIVLNTPGSGYPAASFTTPDATFNTATSASNLYTTSYLVKPGDIKVRNVYYGTGSSRAFEIE